MKKSRKGVSVIYGTVQGKDGPTSVFLAGKKKKIKCSERIKKFYYRWKRRRIEKKIKADPHTLDEVAEYIKRVYHAREISKRSYNYQEQYKGQRVSLMVQYRPELLGEFAKIEKLKVYNEAFFKKFWDRIEEQRKRAEMISDTEFPMDFHIYQIKISKSGRMRICMDNVWNLLDFSYSGEQKDMKKLRRIAKEICSYYGVTKEDIEKCSKRYSFLVVTLSTS